jgi:hypothetical protein
MDADAGRLGRRRLSEGEEARVEPGSLRGLRVVATPAPVTPEDLAVLQTDVLVGLRVRAGRGRVGKAWQEAGRPGDPRQDPPLPPAPPRSAR